MRFLCWLLFAGLISIAVGSCKKADKFYEKLDALPQINNMADSAYKAAYVVGETLTIRGKLQPQAADFSVTIGNISATITNKVSVVGQDGISRDQVSVLITEEMAGKAREVKVTSGGYSTLGANIDVYTEGGEGSFEAILANRLVASFSSNDNVFLHCISGGGEVYYFSPSDKKLYRVARDGTQTELYDLSAGVQPGNIAIAEFMAGGVSPDGGTLYFSARSSGNDYLFARIALSTRTLTLINRSAGIASPFQGNAADVKMVVTGIYPGNDGKVYLGLGYASDINYGYRPGAIAIYRTAGNTVHYLFKDSRFSRTFAGGLPGTVLILYDIDYVRFSPSEDIVYVMRSNALIHNIVVYDLLSGTKLQTLSAQNNDLQFNVITSFPSFKFVGQQAFYNLNTSYGYLPMPGRRLQALLYQQVSGSVTQANTLGFPRWIVFDFGEERTYSYAQDRFRMGNYAFRKLNDRKEDVVLNYDEDGNLYSTANGLTTLIATRPL